MKVVPGIQEAAAQSFDKLLKRDNNITIDETIAG